MDRRGFLKALMAAAVLPTLGRVYSFPTNIVIAKPTRTYLFGRDAIFHIDLSKSATIATYSDYAYDEWDIGQGFLNIKGLGIPTKTVGNHRYLDHG